MRAVVLEGRVGKVPSRATVGWVCTGRGLQVRECRKRITAQIFESRIRDRSNDMPPRHELNYTRVEASAVWGLRIGAPPSAHSATSYASGNTAALVPRHGHVGRSCYEIIIYIYWGGIAAAC